MKMRIARPLQLTIVVAMTFFFYSCSQPDLSSPVLRVVMASKRPGYYLKHEDQYAHPNAGSAFLAKYNKHLFIVTNYHVMANRYACDTTGFDKGYGEIPTVMEIKFRDTKGEIIEKSLNIMDGSKRLFFSFPASQADNSVIDIAIMPVDELPNGTVNTLIDFDAVDTTWSIPAKSKLLLCGFKGDENLELTEPTSDTVTSFDDRVFTYNDRWIYALMNFSISGDSGSPVYCLIGGKPKLVGIVSQSMKNNIPLPYKVVQNAKSVRPFHAFEGLKALVGGIREADAQFFPKDE